MDELTGNDVQGMVTHWLETPVNGYLGSGYGSNVKDLLQAPLQSGRADAVINKMRGDIPLVAALPRGVLEIVMADRGPDRRDLYINVLGRLVPVGGK
ncbi:hypothetical protein [Burkholderia ambifaria]|uniref:hypothetical protein n=1 Tax=Burkholderia ambifaria TaxID=152480 RepID=UPI001589E94E|nr:hypothetical protein [Burkholderia ambifaria]